MTPRNVWTRALSSAAIGVLLAGCQSVGGGCPVPAKYSRAQQSRAEAEIRARPKSELAVFAVDYGKLRDACRVH